MLLNILGQPYFLLHRIKILNIEYLQNGRNSDKMYRMLADRPSNCFALIIGKQEIDKEAAMTNYSELMFFVLLLPIFTQIVIPLLMLVGFIAMHAVKTIFAR